MDVFHLLLAATTIVWLFLWKKSEKKLKFWHDTSLSQGRIIYRLQKEFARLTQEAKDIKDSIVKGQGNHGA